MTSGDYGHVHIASGDDEPVGVGITSDLVVQMLANDANASSASRPLQSRAPIDQSRWSESYPASVRSRSSSIGNNVSNHGPDNPAPRLHKKPSYDMAWHVFDERDEVAVSEDETDDDHHLPEGEDEDDKDEERTSAAVIADEGRGLIVRADSIPIVQLHVQIGESIIISRASLH